MMGEAIGHPFQNVSVVNLKLANRLDPKCLSNRSFVSGIRQLPRCRHDHDYTIVKNARAPVECAPRAPAKDDSAALLGNLAVAEQAIKINRSQDVGFIKIHRSQNNIAAETEDIVTADDLLQRCAMSTPQLRAVFFRPM